MSAYALEPRSVGSISTVTVLFTSRTKKERGRSLNHFGTKDRLGHIGRRRKVLKLTRQGVWRILPRKRRVGNENFG